MTTLKGWKEFCELRRSGQTLCDAQTLANLNRFRARFKAAKHFQTVVIDGYSDATTRGYSVGIRLLMCYTAAELLGETIGPKVNSWTILDTSLLAPLRNACGNVHENESVISNRGLQKKLKEFVDGRDDDLRVVATGLRVMVAHGHFTPSGTKAVTKKTADAIHGLGSHLLVESEKYFNDWLAKQIVVMQK
jgi:hypothetical protein